MSDITLPLSKPVSHGTVYTITKPIVEKTTTAFYKFLEWAFFCNIFTCNRYWTCSNRLNAFIISAIAQLTIVGTIFHILHAIYSRGYSTLHRAQDYGNQEAVLRCLSYVKQPMEGYELVLEGKESKESLDPEFIFWTIENFDSDNLKRALQRGASVNAPNAQGYPPLLFLFKQPDREHLTAEENYFMKLGIVEVLMEFKADPIKFIKGDTVYPETPLNSAFEYYYKFKAKYINAENSPPFTERNFDSIIECMITPLIEQGMDLDDIIEGLGKQTSKEKEVSTEHLENRFYHSAALNIQVSNIAFPDLWKDDSISSIINYIICKSEFRKRNDGSDFEKPIEPSAREEGKNT